jgi:hypothetical protein
VIILNEPIISWHVLEEIDEDDFEYMQCKTYNEEGSFTPGDVISKTIQVWNNYSGNNNVKDIKNGRLVIAFKNFEDSYLLRLISVTIDNNEPSQIEIDIDKGVVDIGNLSGVANNGSFANSSNYKTIHISIGPIPENIKSELKSMYFYLEYEFEQE